MCGHPSAQRCNPARSWALARQSLYSGGSRQVVIVQEAFAVNGPHFRQRFSTELAIACTTDVEQIGSELFFFHHEELRLTGVQCRRVCRRQAEEGCLVAVFPQMFGFPPSSWFPWPELAFSAMSTVHFGHRTDGTACVGTQGFCCTNWTSRTCAL